MSALDTLRERFGIASDQYRIPPTPIIYIYIYYPVILKYYS